MGKGAEGKKSGHSERAGRFLVAYSTAGFSPRALWHRGDQLLLDPAKATGGVGRAPP